MMNQTDSSISDSIIDFPYSPISSWPLSPILSHPRYSQTSNAFSDFEYSDDTDMFDDVPIDGYHQSKTVNPASSTVDVSSIPLTAEQYEKLQELFSNPLVSTIDTSSSTGIKILAQPRPLFRPRTEKEFHNSSHYIRCLTGSPHEHPTIAIPASWPRGETMIRVALVRLDHKPHLYTLDNKERAKSDWLFKLDKECHALYYHLTDMEHQSGKKTFLIEHIKNRQQGGITKKKIKKRKLHQSKLEFTRYYKMLNGNYQVVPDSVVYSDIMTEHYGDFKIIDVFPQRGPMCGNEKICIQTKGTLPDDSATNFTVEMTCDADTQWKPPIHLQRRAKDFIWLTPPCPDVQAERVDAMIRIKYHDRELNTTYSGGLAMSDTTGAPSFGGRLPVMPTTRQGVKRLRH